MPSIYLIIKHRNGLTSVVNTGTIAAERIVYRSLTQPFPDQFRVEHIIWGHEIDYKTLKFSASCDKDDIPDANRESNWVDLDVPEENVQVPVPEQMKLDIE